LALLIEILKIFQVNAMNNGEIQIKINRGKYKHTLIRGLDNLVRGAAAVEVHREGDHGQVQLEPA
jgi:N-acetyl-gamma-glutamylphosphate reductase